MTHRKDYSVYVQLRFYVPKSMAGQAFTAKFTYSPFNYESQSFERDVAEMVTLMRNPKADSANFVAFDSKRVYIYQRPYAPLPNAIALKEKQSGRQNGAYVIVYHKNGTPIEHIFLDWYYEYENKFFPFYYKTTQATNAQDPNHRVVVQLNTTTCPHTYDGAIKVAEYIVEEIKRNVKSPVVQNIRDWLAESARQRKDPTIWDYMNKAYGGHPDPFLQMALTAWAEKVGPKRDWDHKPEIRDNSRLNRLSGNSVARPLPNGNPSESFYHRYKNYDYYLDVWSNIHYGYVGLSAGFDERILIDGSNFQQILNYNTQGGDPIDDDTAIKIGFKLYEKFGKFAEKLTYQDVLDLLDKTDINQMPESKQVHWCYHQDNPNRIKK